MNEKCNIPHPLQREGTYRWQRLAAGIKPGYYLPDDRSIEDLLAQLAEMATSVRYYDNSANETGSWDEFFRAVYDYFGKELKISGIEKLMNGNTAPHLGLLVGFLQTYQKLQRLINDFPQRHLQFYYQEVLQLQKAAAVADKVCVLLELNKNTEPTLLPADTLLAAGKDALGKELVYATNRTIIVNNAVIAGVRSVLAQKDTQQKVQAIRVSQDALTENITERNGKKGFLAFGNENNVKAEIGFAISSPMFMAKEGRRRISIEIKSNAVIPRGSLKAYYTAPEGWQEVEVDQAPGPAGFHSAKAHKYILVKVYEALPAIIAYDKKIHHGHYTTPFPVLKLVLQNDERFKYGYAFFTELRVADLGQMTVNVEGVKNFTLVNEEGTLNPLKPFKPFGSLPVYNKSYFILGHKEAFNQYLKTFHLAINWKGIPGNLISYYQSYSDWLRDENPHTVSIDHKAFFPTQWSTFKQGNVPGKVEILKNGLWQIINEDVPNKYQKTDAQFQNTFHVLDKIQDKFNLHETSEYNGTNKYGSIKVTCRNNWGHKIYPELASHNLMTIAQGNTTLKVPPQPYTPEFTSLHLDYVLEDNLQSAQSQHQIIHLHPFGINEHPTAQDPVITTAYNSNGQFYIGLSGINKPQIVHLYLARQEGTENLDTSIDSALLWQYLSGNNWVTFLPQDIILDTTLSFSASGFVSLALPPDAFLPHTTADADKVWIRLVTNNDITAFPYMIAVHTNAVEAEFINQNNDAQHLSKPLAAGSIAKFKSKSANIKSVTQPYPSYGGKAQENEEAFDTRISERLRHKNRAVSLWDYERLVLEQFAVVYKVKVVPHASPLKMRVPGQVLVLVLPAISQMSTQQDLLQPKLSRAVLVSIENYLKSLMSPFAKVQCINPVYEQIRVKCSVKIVDGYDETFYARQLNTDLQHFICPWLADANSSPSFEGKMYASAIINFIEERPYIDYVTIFQASKLEENKWVAWNEMTMGSNEAVILTSVEQHEIDTQAIC